MASSGQVCTETSIAHQLLWAWARTGEGDFSSPLHLVVPSPPPPPPFPRIPESQAFSHSWQSFLPTHLQFTHSIPNPEILCFLMLSHLIWKMDEPHWTSKWTSAPDSIMLPEAHSGREATAWEPIRTLRYPFCFKLWKLRETSEIYTGMHTPSLRTSPHPTHTLARPPEHKDEKEHASVV